MIANAIHSIDLALSLTGPVTRVHAMTATTLLHEMEAEDFAVAGLQFANGAVGSFVVSTAMFPHRTETITLHFQNGTLRINKDELQVHWRDGQTETKAKPIADRALFDGKFVWHQAVIENFVDAISNNRPPKVIGREALI